MEESIRRLIDEKRLEYSNSLIVLKGYNNQLGNWGLDEINSNKFAFFNHLQTNKEMVISYEQYLLIRDFALVQYANVLIFDNNIYFNQYRANEWLSNDVLEQLVNHFDEDRSDINTFNTNIENYLEIYSNLKKVDAKYYVTYNQFLTDSKELIFTVYNDSKFEIFTEYKENLKTIDIIDELDYLRLLSILENDPSCEIQIIYENIGLNEDVVLEKVQLLRGIYPKSRIRIVNNPNTDSIEIIPETQTILEKYWKAREFRNITLYDLNEVKNGRRKIDKINQGEIISKLIEQVELCKENKNYRDMFLTAPTGSGKSAMFQIPAIYLAEKYNLFTLVISPLIGLMKDQVQGLESREYPYSRTINSDISPIIKQQIVQDIADETCHILYLSPESLMGKSDLVNIIGERKLGLLVIDEAHIVTTGGKQFRPD